jgi:hypothetical protein
MATIPFGSRYVKQRIARIDERRFFVSLDGGRKLRATHARLEGDEPKSLTILMDLSQSNPGIMLSADQKGMAVLTRSQAYCATA